MPNQRAKDKKRLGFYVNEALLQELNNKIAIDCIEKTELFECAINAYLNNEYLYTAKSGKKISIKIEIEE